MKWSHFLIERVTEDPTDTCITGYYSRDDRAGRFYTGRTSAGGDPTWDTITDVDEPGFVSAVMDRLAAVSGRVLLVPYPAPGFTS